MLYNFRYDPEKNKQLISSRGVSFEELITSMENGGILGYVDNPVVEREHQKLFIVEYNGYTYSIPCVPEGDNTFFLKTIIPSRKYHKLYQ